jgi:hypothetical protein
MRAQLTFLCLFVLLCLSTLVLGSKVYTWGKNEDGVLGLPWKNSYSLQNPLVMPRRFKQFSASSSLAVGLGGTGICYMKRN